MKQQKKQNKKYVWYIGIICVLTVSLNLLACIDEFCIFYREHIYGYIASGLGFVMSAVPFPVGELLMYVGAVMVLVLVILLLVSFMSAILRLGFAKVVKTPKDEKQEKYQGCKRFLHTYLKVFFAIASTVLLIYTTNWVIPFRAPMLDVRPEINRKYTVEELQILRNHTVQSLNAIAEEIGRDADGRILLCDDLHAEISSAMNQLAGEFPLLKGYYPREKASLCSSFLEWMSIGGYTYPYTMEVSHNKYLGYLYMPVLLSHEQSHHKGYYQENEATFLSILACSNSASQHLQYAGYLEFYYYIERDYIRSMLNVYQDDLARELIAEQPKLSDLVRADQADSIQQSDELYRQEVSIRFEEFFKKYAQEAGDAGWKAQGEIIGDATYGGCVKYLLEYYDGVLY